MEEQKATVVRVPSSKDVEKGCPPAPEQRSPEGPKPNKFKVMGILAQAVKRFQANMNPTYTYGKRPHGATSDQPPAVVRKQSLTGTALDPQDSKKGSKVLGKRTSIIFAPLPPPEVAQPDKFPELQGQVAPPVEAS